MLQISGPVFAYYLGKILWDSGGLMKRSNVFNTLGMLLFVAFYAASTNNAHSGGYIDAGISIGNPFGTGFGHRGGLCGLSCAGSGFSSQFNGLPARLPQQPLPHNVPVMPYGHGGWVSGGGGGFPGGGFPGGGFPGGGFPGGGFPGGGFPGGGFHHCGFNPCGGNNFYPPIHAQLPPMQVPGGPCGGGCFNRGPAGGGTTIIDMRSRAEWEKNDTAGIIWGVSAGLSSMTSNVYPVAFPRQDFTIPDGIYHQGPRVTGFEPRPGLQNHNGGSAFQ
jgi:hypothetical protein